MTPLGLLDRDDVPPNRPEREAGQLEVGPGEGQSDNGDGQAHSNDDMADGEPPAGEHQPDEIANEAERASPEIFPSVEIARNDRVAERKQSVEGNRQGRPGPWQPIIVTAIRTAATTQPTAIQIPPKRSHSTLSSKLRSDIEGPPSGVKTEH
jgi:hypothetical protein